MLINSEGDVEAISGNTEFNDLGIEIPVGEYLVVKVLPPTCKLKEQLGCTLVNYSGAIYAARERGEITTKKRLHSLTQKGIMKATNSS